jgi:hypothetical protein
MQKKTLAGVAAIAFFSIWATPAMAQTFDGGGGSFGDTPTEMGFVVPNQLDYGLGCSRSRPNECTPQEKDDYNRSAALWCAIGGGIAGYLGGLVVGAAVSALATPAAGVPAGQVYNRVAGPVAIAACYAKFRIP